MLILISIVKINWKSVSLGEIPGPTFGVVSSLSWQFWMLGEVDTVREGNNQDGGRCAVKNLTLPAERSGLCPQLLEGHL